MDQKEQSSGSVKMRPRCKALEKITFSEKINKKSTEKINKSKK